MVDVTLADMVLRAVVRTVVAGVLVVAVVACGNGESGQPAGRNTPAGDATAPPAEAVDACALLTSAEVTGVIGGTDGGKPASGGDDGGGCAWTNEENQNSITLSIGATGTAASGTLPPEDPNFAPYVAGPDGIRFAAGNLAEFIVDDRGCDIQVVTSVTDERDRPTAVRLIGLIRGRL